MGKPKVKIRISPAKIEQARDSAMTRALFYWEIAKQTMSNASRIKWNGRGYEAAGAAIRLDETLRGSDE